jgi:putative ATP-dependent endonuclease of the OLD family
MLISSLRVKNFRSIRDEIFNCRDLTVLVGPNGSGKSTVLRAIELFYSETENISADDFFNEDTSQEIVIAITFRDLDDEAIELFDKYLASDETLTVDKVITWNEEGKKKFSTSYHGAAPRNPDFTPIREQFGAGDRGAKSKAALEKLQASGKYQNLPGWSTLSGTKESLINWEYEHPDRCEMARDDGQFFGFKEVAKGYLGRFTRCLYVPAVRDASDDAEEGRDSIFSEMMDLVVRNTLSKRKELKELREELQTRYEEIVSLEKLPEVGNLATQLSSTLKAYIPTAEVILDWLPTAELSLPNPRAKMRLVEDGYPSPVDKCGHGLQRAFIFTMLQHLAVAQIPGSVETEISENRDSKPVENPEEIQKLPSLILIIEEPELYQHPNRQRHFAKILSDLSTGATPGVADKTQVIYTSHSPYFVGIDRVDELRVLKKCPIVDGLPKETKVVQTSLDAVAEELWNIDGKPEPKYTAETLKPRLTHIMTPRINEGFFADLAVLVEGEDDYSAVTGMAKVLGIDLESYGISIIPCGGKNNIDRPAVIFKQLGIQTYLLWDGDEGDGEANPKDNHALLKLVGINEIEDWPSGIYDSCACFKVDLEDAMQSDIGAKQYDSYLCTCKEKYAIRKHKHAKKNPNVIKDMIIMAQNDGVEFNSLRAILEKILEISKIPTSKCTTN